MTSKRTRVEPGPEVVARFAKTALALRRFTWDAWTGVRRRVRTKIFAHAMVAHGGRVADPAPPRG